jgi:hypothetical protein
MTEDITVIKNILSGFLNQQLTSLLASNVILTAGQRWYDCFSIKLRHIPSFGHVKIYYEFDEIDSPVHFSHRLKFAICDLNDKDGSLGDNSYDFKIKFDDNFEVKKVKLLGRLILFTSDSKTNEHREINIIHFQSDNVELLIRPEFSTARLLFCIDRQEINDFLKSAAISNHDNETFEQIEISV